MQYNRYTQGELQCEGKRGQNGSIMPEIVTKRLCERLEKGIKSIKFRRRIPIDAECLSQSIKHEPYSTHLEVPLQSVVEQNIMSFLNICLRLSELPNVFTIRNLRFGL